MRGYWLRIAGGSLLVFVVGYGGFLGVRSLVHQGKALVTTAEPISIPVRFMSFSLEGTEVGTFQRVVIRRKAPDALEGIDFRVKLEDSVLAESLRGCRLVPVGGNRFDLAEGFRCLEEGAADSLFGDLGEVRVRGPGGIDFRIPLLVPRQVLADMVGAESIDHTVDLLRANDAEAQAREAERRAQQAVQHAESVSAAVRARVRELAPPPPIP